DSDDRPVVGIAAAEDDGISRRGEFFGVGQKVPEDLLKPDAVAAHVMTAGAQVGAQVGLAAGTADLDGAADYRVQVDRLKMELKLPARDARQVEKIVDEPSFQLDVTADRLDVVLHVGRQLRRRLQQRNRKQHRREGGAQLMAEHREELI